ncbi:MAG: hypothetical protein K6U74_11410, partial [Firmicutes bacterium]|nr:hypothetical protein [Bacillota bacterium]
WAEFVNACACASAVYDREAGELKMVFGPGSYIAFREGRGKSKEIFLHLEDAGVLTDSLAIDAARLLELAEVKIFREIRGVVLDLDRLRRELGFQAGTAPGRFIKGGDFTALYDAGGLEATFAATVPLDGRPVQERVRRLYQDIEEFTGRLMSCVV